MSHALPHTEEVSGLGPANAAADWLGPELAPIDHKPNSEPWAEAKGHVVRHGDEKVPAGFVDTVKPERAATIDISLGVVRPFDKIDTDTFSGMHGAVIERRTVAHDGPMQPWDDDRVTARNAPLFGWDAGIELDRPLDGFVF